MKNKTLDLTAVLAMFISIAGLAMAKLAFAAQVPSHLYKPDGYHIHTINTPKDVQFHVTGLDSAQNGDLYAATRFGEVWRYHNGRWSKFAAGLHEPTGLLIDDDGSIVVAQKPELTRLIDKNDDGVADEYQHITGDWQFHDNYHEYTFGPVKDRQGNYFGTLNLGHNVPNGFALGAMSSAGGYRGFAFKADAQGHFEPYAWGLRSPAGIGHSPDGKVFFTDNQGDWVPTSKLHLLEQGKFYGHPVSLIDRPGYTRETVRNLPLDTLAEMSEKPVAWIPHLEVANSPGNPEWDISNGQFGPFTGQMFIGDQTQSNIFRVLLDQVNGQYQGAVINFMNRFQSGNIRLEMDKSGQLWVGQTAAGWAAAGGKPFGLQKVVWDGTNPFELLNIKLTRTGFLVQFTAELDPVTVTKHSFSGQHWGYHYSSNYGSPKQDLTPITINKVSLLADNKTVKVDLSLPSTAGKVVQLNFAGLSDIKGRKNSTQTVYYTLNEFRR